MKKTAGKKSVERGFRKHSLVPLLFMVLSCAAAWADSPAAPYANPYLAASSYPIIHSRSVFTPIAGPVGPSRRLRADEIQWKGLGPLNASVTIYSAPYPNGKRVIWVGGYDRVAKLDADTLEVLTTYAIGGKTFFDTDAIERHITTAGKLDGEKLVDYSLKFWREPWRSAAPSYYRMLTRDNEFYLPGIGTDGAQWIRVYGEADANDPASPIQLRREWKIPADISTAPVLGLSITPDGWIVIATMDGKIIVSSRDFTSHQYVALPDKGGDRSSQDVFSAFVRNNMTLDDQGGIYVVSRDYMQRVQWTGNKLSLDEADGAWKAEYPNEIGAGSGSSPGLMGWGPQEDHLVGITDGSRNNNEVVFWRDAIPADWKGIPGYDRRVAGITPIHFGVSKDEQVQVENSQVVYGDGVFVNQWYSIRSPQKTSDPQGASKRFVAEVSLPGREARGAAMIRWDRQARVLKTAWQNQTNLLGTVCTVSSATEMVYCWGQRNLEWTLEGIDWNTGKSAFHYTLGKSQRFNPMAGLVTVAPNGAVDCGCTGGLGIVRVNPRKSHATAK